jgi:hypothetical protein
VTDLKQLLQLLSASKVDFILVGGMTRIPELAASLAILGCRHTMTLRHSSVNVDLDAPLKV